MTLFQQPRGFYWSRKQLDERQGANGLGGGMGERRKRGEEGGGLVLQELAVNAGMWDLR